MSKLGKAMSEDSEKKYYIKFKRYPMPDEKIKEMSESMGIPIEEASNLYFAAFAAAIQIVDSSRKSDECDEHALECECCQFLEIYLHNNKPRYFVDDKEVRGKDLIGKEFKTVSVKETISISVTGQQMCELISKYFKEKFNIDKSFEEIWYYSPTGELAEVYYWYEDALEWFEDKEKRLTKPPEDS